MKKKWLILLIAGAFMTGAVLAPKLLKPTWHLDSAAAVLWFEHTPLVVSDRFLRALQMLSSEEWADPKLGDRLQWRFKAPDAPDTIHAILTACGGPQEAHATFQRGIGIYHVHLERYGSIIPSRDDRWRWQVFIMLPDEKGTVRKRNVQDEALARQIAAPLLEERGINQ